MKTLLNASLFVAFSLILSSVSVISSPHAQADPSVSVTTRSVSAGDSHTCAVLSDGSVTCWGANWFGQLGNGSTDGSSVPVTVSDVSGAVSVSAGDSHTCAVLSDGSVACWGRNGYGQIGQFQQRQYLTPSAVRFSSAITLTPSISGVAQVGQVLTVSPGSSVDGVDVVFEWRRSGADAVVASTSTYSAVAADVGHTLAVTVTASKAGYDSASAVSASTAAVTLGVFSSPTPILLGHAWVGKVLTIVPGDWSTTVSFSYRWLCDGRVIPGQVGPTLKLSGSTRGHRISAHVSGTAPGYVAQSLSTAQSMPVVGSIPVRAIPQLSSADGLEPRVGGTVMASVGQWSPGTTFVYRWYRSGVIIPGKDTAQLVLSSSDYRKQIRVEVLASNDNYADTLVSSPVMRITGLGVFTSADAPVISGSAVVGQVLTANVNSWTPAVDSLSYSWMRDGVAIRGATAGTYQVRAVDVGKAITVRISGRKTAYATTVRVSASTALVVK